MKYKVGDKVRIKSLDWYNDNKNDINYVGLTIDSYNVIDFTEPMAAFCGKVMTIAGIRLNFYYMLEDSGMYSWTDEMFEGLVEEETKPKGTKEEWCCPEGYIFKDENGNIINATKIILEKKKEYPKTYEECAKVLLDRASVRNDFGYKGELLVTLQKLLVCRDAYWNIAGEEMGLRETLGT